MFEFAVCHLASSPPRADASISTHSTMRDPEAPTVDDVPSTPEEENALVSLRAALSEENVVVPRTMCANGGETGALLRYLRARKLDVAKAMAMLRATIAWRAENDIDALLSSPLDEDEFRANAAMYPASYHGEDAAGRPVYMERTGSARFAALVQKLGQEGFLRMHLRGMEYQYRVLLPSASVRKNAPVTQMCNVIDVGELSLYDTVSHGEVLAALKNIAAVDADHYPENLGTTLVCNAPWSFTTAWSVVRLFLDAKTQAKFKVLGKGDAQLSALREALGGIEKVPAFLGGECACPGGCVCLDPAREPTERVLTDAQVRYARFCIPGEGETEKDAPGDVAEGIGALALTGDAGDAAAKNNDAPEP